MDNKDQLLLLINKVIFAVTLIFFFLFPLFYLTSTTEFNEYNKLVLLLLTAGILVVLWLLKSIIDKRFVVVKTRFDIPLLLIGLVFILSTVGSVSPYNSIFGEFNSWHWTAVEMVGLISLYYSTISNIRSWQKTRWLVTAMLSSIFIVALSTTLVYFNVFDALNIPQSMTMLQVLTLDGFSPAGNLVSTILILVVGFLLGVFLLRGELIGDEENKKRNPIKIATFGVIVLSIGVGLILWLAPYIPGVPARVSIPSSLSFGTSWRIASSTIRDYPFFGIGPSNYAVSYNAYRPISINQTDAWSVIYNQAGNEYMDWLTTLGVVGLFGLGWFVIKVLIAARKILSTTLYSKSKRYNVRVAVILGIIAIVIAYFFMPSTVATSGVLFMLLILWMLIEKQEDDGMAGEVVLSLAAMKERLFVADDAREASMQQGVSATQVMSWLIMTPVAIVWIGISYFVIQDYRSNLTYVDSLSKANSNGTIQEIYDAQRGAINLNPRRDIYHRVYAGTNINLAGAIANQRGESITDTERADVTTLIKQAIQESRVITEIINPTSALNWQVRGNIYQNLLGVATDAEKWALDSYQKAIQLAPFDPRLRVNLGGLYFTLALNTPAEGTQGEAPGEEVATLPKSKQANLALAEAAFLDAINLKPDYANAHYNLAAVYIQAERYDLAKTQLETTLRLVPADSADYKRAQQDLDKVNKLIEEKGS